MFPLGERYNNNIHKELLDCSYIALPLGSYFIGLMGRGWIIIIFLNIFIGV